MLPTLPCRVSQVFADPGSYASVSDEHGYAGHHTGVDFGSLWPVPIEGRLVRSVLGGEVVISEHNSVMGHWVGVYNPKHDLLVTYWHMQGRRVEMGDWVRPYTPLGRVGNTGNSTAAHLHVQVNRGSTFDYHGHISPWTAFRILKRRNAKRLFKRGPHPRA